MNPHPQTEKENPSHGHGQNSGRRNTLRLVAWETTRNCNLSCVHCRASATNGPYAGELDTGQAFKLLGEIAQIGSLVMTRTKTHFWFYYYIVL